VPPKYVSYYANAFGRQYFIDEGKQTTNLASISMRKVAALPVPVASPEEMEEVLRRIEAAFGRRDFGETGADPVLGEIIGRRSVFESLLRYLRARGWQVPAEVLNRDPREPWPGDGFVLALLAEVYEDAGTSAEVCEALVDIDEGLQEWRYRHVKAVERIMGAGVGTGGSSGVEYLRGTLFRPVFRDLWEIRSRA